MSGVTKTLLRSILRWTKYPHVKYAPFQIDLTRVVNKHKSLQQLKKVLPSGLQTINDAAGVRAAALYCYRTGAEVTSAPDASSEDTMFAVLKYLNSRSLELKIACNSREYRSCEEVQQNARVRVGQVLQHKDLGYRAVCVGWTVYADGKKAPLAEAPGTAVETPTATGGRRQRLKLLVDWFDLSEVQLGEGGTEGGWRLGDVQEEEVILLASEFRVMPPGSQARINHPLLAKHFCRYDSLLGAYVPNKSLQFQYPLDTSHVLDASGLFNRLKQHKGEKEDTKHRYIPLSRSSSSLPPTEANLKQTAFSSAHLEALASDLKAHHRWSGGEIYSVHQEKLAKASSEVIRLTEQLSSDFRQLVESLDLSSTLLSTEKENDGTKNLHQVVLGKDVMKFLEKANESPLTPSCSVLSHDDRRVQSLLQELWVGQDSGSWDDNFTLPLTPEQSEQRRAVTALSSATTLYMTVEQALVLRFQNLRGRVSEFELRVPGAIHRAEEEWKWEGAELLPSVLEPPVKFRLGQVLRNKTLGYNGVCAGWDVRPVVDTSHWKGQQGAIGQQLGMEQPFYRMIPDKYDVSSFHYVAQENLEPVDGGSGSCSSVDSSGDSEMLDTKEMYNNIAVDRLLDQIKHREAMTVRNVNMGLCFDGFDMKRGVYKAKEELEFCFSLLNEQDVPMDAAKAHAFAECEEVLLGLFRLLREFFLAFQSPPAENRLLLLLKHASSRQDAAVLEGVHWLACMATPPASSPCAMLMREGMAALNRGDQDLALRLYLAASHADPSFGEAYNKAGGVHAMRNDHEGALACSALTLQRNPRHYAALAGQGLALAAIAENSSGASCKYKDALASLRGSLDLNPWNSQVSSRYTALLHEKDKATSSAAGGGGGRKKKGSLRVVHLTSSEEDEEEDGADGKEGGEGAESK